MDDTRVFTISADDDDPDYDGNTKEMKAVEALKDKDTQSPSFPSLSGYSFSTDIHPKNEKAESFCKLIANNIKAYESSLKGNRKVVMLLGSYAREIRLQVAEIGFYGPHIMLFRGFVDGEPVELIQHVNQINYLLTSVDKDSSQVLKPIKVLGFVGTDIVGEEN